MRQIARLTPEQTESALAGLPGWQTANGKLHREYKFSSFQTAIAFMNEAVPLIEAMDHHPEWCNVYSRVTVDLSTHSENGITALDVELAGKLESIAKKYS